MTRVTIIGAGQLGSRHLQALQAVRTPLEIDVVDPSVPALETAKTRYESADAGHGHRARFGQALESSAPADIAIVATNADTRIAAVSDLLSRSSVRYLLLEKLLFDRRADAERFAAIAVGTTAWVNCPMRIVEPYEWIRAQLGPGPVDYRVSGSAYGLITNAIHYLDHVAHLAGCGDFTLDTRGLDPMPVQSKRRGFLEMHGRLVAAFADGSRCDIRCDAEGNAPVLVEIFGPRGRFIVREDQGQMWAASSSRGWTWIEREARIPFQSELTTAVVERLLHDGSCGLTPLSESVRIHLQLLEPVRAVLDDARVERDRFPFT